MASSSLLGVTVVVLGCLAAVHARERPHIVFIVADDLGWDDVGFRSHQINTPNIDRLAAHGRVLDQYYVQDVCSPSRASFLSGRYPLHHSINDWIPPASSYGLPLNITTMADIMLKMGYDTHAVGKWHLGFYKWAYTPTFRGFNSFYGFYSGGEDYFKHTSSGAYDFRHDASPRCGQNCSTVASSASGHYSTTLFTSQAVDLVNQHDTSTPLFLYLAYQAVHAPSEVPERYIKPYEGKIHDKHRRVFAGMLSAMDEGIGNVTAALEAKGMTDNLIIVFTTDNGGPVPGTPGGDYVGSRNFPLRGGKHTIWEGGTRGTAVLHTKISTSVASHSPTSTSSAPPECGRGLACPDYKHLMHACDWLPTLTRAAATSTQEYNKLIAPLELDGVDQWGSLMTVSGPAARSTILYGQPDDIVNASADNGLRTAEGWKLLRGTGGTPGDWPPPVNITHSRTGVVPLSRSTPMPLLLFNLTTDPSEHHDVAHQHATVAAQLHKQLEQLLSTGVPTAHDDPSCPKVKHPVDPRVGPVWAPWCG